MCLHTTTLTTIQISDQDQEFFYQQIAWQDDFDRHAMACWLAITRCLHCIDITDLQWIWWYFNLMTQMSFSLFSLFSIDVHWVSVSLRLAFSPPPHEHNCVTMGDWLTASAVCTLRAGVARGKYKLDHCTTSLHKEDRCIRKKGRQCLADSIYFQAYMDWSSPHDEWTQKCCFECSLSLRILNKSSKDAIVHPKPERCCV